MVVLVYLIGPYKVEVSRYSQPRHTSGAATLEPSARTPKVYEPRVADDDSILWDSQLQGFLNAVLVNRQAYRSSVSTYYRNGCCKRYMLMQGPVTVTYST